MKRISLALALVAAGSLALSGAAHAQHALTYGPYYVGDTFTHVARCGQTAFPVVEARSDGFVPGTVKLDYDRENGTTITAKIVDKPGNYDLTTRCVRAEPMTGTLIVKAKQRPAPPNPPQPQPKPNKPPQVKVKPVGPPQTGGGATAQS